MEIYMKYIADTEFALENTAVSLGKFDGIHLGHRLLLDYIKSQKKKGLTSVVFTFLLHPSNLFSDREQQLLYTEEEKKRILEDTGVDVMISYPFTNTTSHMNARNFIERILVGKLHAKVIAVGEDFRFGKDRAGDVKLLQELSGKYGYTVKVFEKEKYEGKIISSTYIREALEAGEMERIHTLLKEPYFVSGNVMPGNRIGRTLGMPTANLMPDTGKLLPPAGVYATRTLFRGKEYIGVTNVGVKPTIGDGYKKGVETFLFDIQEEFYGEFIQVSFYRYIRPERKFDSIEELKAQMEKDVLSVREYFA